MKKNILKIGIIILLVIAIVFPSFSYAVTVDGLGDLDKYKKDPSGMGVLEDKAETIIVIIRTLGIIVSVITLMVMGIKYMLGSLEQKAEYKKDFKPYLIGALLVFSVSWVPELIYRIMKNIG